MQPSSTSPSEKDPPHDPSIEIQKRLIVVILALGGLIGALLMQGTS